MMKRIALIFALCIGLAACGSNPAATVTFGDKENPGRVTGVSGLESRDVTNMVNYGAYTSAKATAPQKEVCSIKGIKGQTMTMSGVESITCYAPEADTLAKPTQVRSAFVENTEAVGNLIQKATPMALGGMALSDRNSARKAATEQAQIAADAEVEMETLRSTERGNAYRDPIIVTIPDGGSASILSTD